jgi:FkbM family methyltransferase
MLSCKLKYKDENGKDIKNESIERKEQLIAEAFILDNSSVLELGARYGTVSCIINKRLKDPTKQVSIEADERVIKALEKNKKRNKCEFNIVYGTVSKSPLKLENVKSFYGYGTTSVKDENSTIPNHSVSSLEEKYNLKFDTLVADCEGCLCDFLDENPTFIDQLHTIFFEKDYVEKCNYSVIVRKLKKNGFIPIVTDSNHELWRKGKSKRLGGRRKTKRRNY